MNVASAGRRVCPRWPIERVGPLEEHERFLLRVERELLRVVGVVEPQRDDRARLRTAAARRPHPRPRLARPRAAASRRRRWPRESRRRTRRVRASSVAAFARRAGSRAVPRLRSRSRRAARPARAARSPARRSAARRPATSVMNSVTSAISRAIERIRFAVVLLLPEHAVDEDPHGERVGIRHARARRRSVVPIGQNPSRHLKRIDGR